jgi:histidinol dehydrogenase
MIRIPWDRLKADDFVYSRPFSDTAVERIVEDVRERGDTAVFEYTLKYDRVKLSHLRVPIEQIRKAGAEMEPTLMGGMKKMCANLRKFAERQKRGFADFVIETEPGVKTGQKVVPIDRVGVYVPGGRYPLFSSLLMAAIPARVAGVDQIAVASPPDSEGNIHPSVLAAAQLADVDEIYTMGGAQAIAALAFGTSSVYRVNKIVGPGNRFVNMAKKIVYGQVGIDFIAGPSEILILADGSAEPRLIAADLIAQAEHDPDAIPILVTNSETLADSVVQEVERQLASLEICETARAALDRNGRVILVDTLDDAVSFANNRAPEHLELFVRKPELLESRLRNFGSLFIGPLSAEILGDYTSGLNHILPTGNAARYTGGLGVKDFMKVQTTLEVDRRGLLNIGPAAVRLAQWEKLQGHARSVQLRLEEATGSLEKD